MGAIYVSWAISGAVLLGLAAAVGLAANSRIDGILIDCRGRYSLTHFQLCLWTITVLSLLSGVFFGRLVHGVADPLDITIPTPVLSLIGITLGSAVTTTAVKRTKDVTRPNSVAASGGSSVFAPRLAQIFLAEEGTFADETVDVGKFQGFVVTIVLVVAYIALVVSAIGTAGTAQHVSSLPGLNETWVVLFGISHGAYITSKIPTSSGKPGLSVETRDSYPDEYRIQKRHALS
jgi:hypothetical protein